MNASERQSALDRARQGDAQALGELLNSFRPYARVLARARHDPRLQARLDESDLIQDALAEAHRSFPSFRGTTVAELVVWLRQIVLRTTGRTVRSLIATDKRDVNREAGPHELAEVPDLANSPSEVAIRHEEAATMAEALAVLPEEMQQVLLARHVDGLPHTEVAKRLGRTEAAVRMLYLRALRRLREILQNGERL